VVLYTCHQGTLPNVLGEKADGVAVTRKSKAVTAVAAILLRSNNEGALESDRL